LTEANANSRKPNNGNNIFLKAMPLVRGFIRGSMFVRYQQERLISIFILADFPMPH
jgi:hypothetical protein